ncbi:hypothetical protein Pmani_032685 [Petrolisthes manimaculis]|uniref:Uncharacterized protein n=1 Tax=Petrolisthes manimaculis TaxID=1843537 RepID=A0AAE1TQV3_9EUCA|nr:hypothetical protein Pmani_032685 [Petrolisthes manimaculis]
MSHSLLLHLFITQSHSLSLFPVTFLCHSSSPHHQPLPLIVPYYQPLPLPVPHHKPLLFTSIAPPPPPSLSTNLCTSPSLNPLNLTEEARKQKTLATPHSCRTRLLTCAPSLSGAR